MKIDASWIKSFTARFRIVSRAHTGKHRSSPKKEEELELSVAVHLGTLCGMFSNGLCEDDVGNADETHFILNMDNGRTLGFACETEVRYADVVSGGEAFTMMVRLSGGVHGRIEPPFIVFMNKNRSYPIKGVPDNVPGVAYRSGPKGWIDTVVMPQYFEENRVIVKLPNGRTRVLFVDNCSGHNRTEDLETSLQKINTTVRYFPPNVTHLVQPCDTFVIQKIKQRWAVHWEKFKMELIQKGLWKDSSGKLYNPGKPFFLKLAARVVREVNLQKDTDGLNFARKAMIISGLSLNTNGFWEVKQLTPALQRIVEKHNTVFDASRSAALDK